MLELVLLGLTDGEIGERLALAPSTVMHHRSDLLHNADVPSTPKFLALVLGEKVAAALAEVERLTRELALLSRRVDEADNRRRGPPDRRGDLGPA